MFSVNVCELLRAFKKSLDLRNLQVVSVQEKKRNAVLWFVGMKSTRGLKLNSSWNWNFLLETENWKTSCVCMSEAAKCCLTWIKLAVRFQCFCSDTEQLCSLNAALIVMLLLSWTSPCWQYELRGSRGGSDGTMSPVLPGCGLHCTSELWGVSTSCLLAASEKHHESLSNRSDTWAAFCTDFITV